VNVITSLSADDARTLYDRCPNDLKQFAYDTLIARFQEQMDQRPDEPGAQKFKDAFPEPREMEQFRVMFKRYLDARNAGNFDVELK
jgi:hypothetical protein